MSDLSIVIVTFNNEAHLAACSALLPDALAGLDAQVIVVDNASHDNSVALARRCWPTAQMIVNDTNRGFARAVNQGLALATGPSILLLNPDTHPEPGSLASLVAYLNDHDTVGIVAPRLLDTNGPVLSCYPFPSVSSIAWRHLQIYRVRPNILGGRFRQMTLSPTATEPVVVPWAQGACMLLRRSMLAAIGGMDEWFVFYGEEVDLTRRAATAGWQCVYIPTARVMHVEGSSAEQVVPFKLVSHYASTLHYFEQHVPWRVPWLKGLFYLDLAWRGLVRLPGLVTGRPPDAALRLRTYWTIASTYLRDRPEQRLERWLRLAAEVTPSRATRQH